MTVHQNLNMLGYAQLLMLTLRILFYYLSSWAIVNN